MPRRSAGRGPGSARWTCRAGRALRGARHRRPARRSPSQQAVARRAVPSLRPRRAPFHDARRWASYEAGNWAEKTLRLPSDVRAGRTTRGPARTPGPKHASENHQPQLLRVLAGLVLPVRRHVAHAVALVLERRAVVLPAVLLA